VGSGAKPQPPTVFGAFWTAQNDPGAM